MKTNMVVVLVVVVLLLLVQLWGGRARRTKPQEPRACHWTMTRTTGTTQSCLLVSVDGLV